MDIRVAAYGVIIDSERMLLAHWSQDPWSAWTLPGGGINEGESPADAAVREIFEETGYGAELEALIGVDSHVIPAHRRSEPEAGPLHAIRMVYRARVVSGELTHEVDGSTDAAAWFPLGDIEELERVELIDAALTMNEAWLLR
ncbi:NUDIX hydrolase [Rathayibacter rathayi]|uniref:NUDIX hydrolase n=1 Tax=Rathayibacter rathayi TaxID=33887 RepID=UPI000CE8DEF5|nr:NUDIX hydrolase [Rathayibacter rathayi]PPF23260.1 DNA mismatch repair protein MutT [Rathayibacter rathayi]PPG66075.1 DNA mismatch repair protein MutT [Rathayibacter rathayi]PPG74434.1 DNA mismatch repair protein MutT [Rathayibacter rathayi]PPG92739.1 DNA mismatch repair protein MutT [Rathayibacter rathayi]PPG93929.1 DNA mismatch repair protein MutT [Rathayibacter rathayi]